MSQSRQMAHLTKDLCQASELRKSTIEAMRQATQATLETFAMMRGEMARDYRRGMHKFLAFLTREVAAHRRNMAHQVAQTQKFLGAMAKDVAAHRHATMNQMARHASARHKATSQLRSSLQRQIDAVVRQTADFRNAAAQIVPALASAHQKMARRQTASLKAGHRKLQANMTKVLGAIHADRMKAHGIWMDLKRSGVA